MKQQRILLKPDHMTPIMRYEIDRGTLESLKVSSELTERIYKSLFVHTIGFYHLLNEILNNIPEGKQAVTTNVWKVYQILLEKACQTDYKMLTKQLEDQNVQVVNNLHEKMDFMTKEIMKQEEHLDEEFRKLHLKENKMIGQRTKLEDERRRVYNEMHVMQGKLEEEVERRLFFEQKLNSLHAVNMKYESQSQQLQEKVEKLTLQNTKLDNQNKELIQ